MKIMMKTHSLHFFRRTARETERRLTRDLRIATSQGPAGRTAFLFDNGLPVWTQGFRTEKAWRGPFMWRVVATENKGH